MPRCETCPSAECVWAGAETRIGTSINCPPQPPPEPVRWHRANTQDDLEAFYHSILPKIREAARKCGYAIGVHGSMRRDLDLIAAPWVLGHSDKDALAREIQRAACGMTQNSYNWGSVPPKPCGRLSTVFPVCWSEYDAPSAGHIDLAVMPSLSNDSDGLDFEAKRLRRVATLMGVAAPVSDEALMAAAGSVLGEIERAIERVFKTPNAKFSGAANE